MHLIEHNLLQEVKPDIVGRRAFAEPGIVVIAAKELDVVVALIEVESQIAAAFRAFQIAAKALDSFVTVGRLRRMVCRACTFSQVTRSMMGSWTLRKIARFSSGFSIRRFIL